MSAAHRSRRRNIAVIFGGVAPEHEVSVITALQAAAHLDRRRWNPVPVYVAKSGAWYTGERLLDVQAFADVERLLEEDAVPVMLDPLAYGALELVGPPQTGLLAKAPRRWRCEVALLGLHGGSGEDGGLQGLCETLNVPYTGSGIFGSALGMDKVLAKHVCRQFSIPIVDFVAFHEGDWAGEEEAGLDCVEETLGYPVVVKPARLGSSIGISRADGRQELDAAIEEAFRYDDKVLVEDAVEKLREVNCSVLGTPTDAQPSVLEEPVPSDSDEVLSFQDKYLREGGGAKGEGGRRLRGGSKRGTGRSAGMASLDRIIPAELPDEQTQEIRDLAVRIFQSFDCSGLARIDFMIDQATGEVYFNEINTIPGSLSYYLWDPTGIPFEELLDRLLEIALARHRARNGRVRTYDVNLLNAEKLSGLKGSKG